MNVSPDFVFGTLATDELRVTRLQAASVGVRHAHDLEPPDPRPGEPVRVRATVGPGVDADAVTCYFTTDDRDPDGDGGDATTGTAIPLARTATRWDTLAWAYVETWTGTIPPQPPGTPVRYRIQAWSRDGRVRRWAEDAAQGDSGATAAATATGRGAAFAYHVDDERVPAWLRDAVIYQVFVDRFAGPDGGQLAAPAAPDGICGGTLRGVRARLDHIARIGATCIWLTPVFPSPSHHGYDATDHGAIEPRLGTVADLRELVADAHARGMRVILDYAVNHVSSAHPAFRRATTDAGAPEASWFLFSRWPDEYETFFGVSDHPRIASDDPDARAYMIDNARRWLELGVDGFRCDYANGPTHAFWSAFRAATRRDHPDSATVGEVVETPELQRSYRGRLDGCLDFLLMQALRRFFAFGDSTASELDAFLRRHLGFFGDDFVLPSFLDNHDMNRFLWVAGGDTSRLRLAALCQFTLPGPPVVYYGNEVGLSQERDVRHADGSGHPEESRLPMAWGDRQDAALLDLYVRLGRLRHAHPGLWRAARETVAVDDTTGLYAWRCRGGSSDAVVALNNGDGEQRLAVEPAASPAAGWRLELATDDGVRLGDDGLVMPSLTGAVLVTGSTSGPRTGRG